MDELKEKTFDPYVMIVEWKKLYKRQTGNRILLYRSTKNWLTVVKNDVNI